MAWPEPALVVQVARSLEMYDHEVREPHGVMAMGDTVVFEDEVTPAMDAAFEHGLEVTALHNHFLFDQPKAYFMHIGGMGDPQELAAGVKAALETQQNASKQQTPEPRKR